MGFKREVEKQSESWMSLDIWPEGRGEPRGLYRVVEIGTYNRLPGIAAARKTGPTKDAVRLDSAATDSPWNMSLIL
jgi:hypothetical protein